MANSKQAAKRARQAKDANARNRSVRSDLRTAVKSLRKLVSEGNKDGVASQLRVVESKADKAAKRRVIHANTADRIKARVKKLTAAK